MHITKLETCRIFDQSLPFEQVLEVLREEAKDSMSTISIVFNHGDTGEGKSLVYEIKTEKAFPELVQLLVKNSRETS